MSHFFSQGLSAGNYVNPVSLFRPLNEIRVVLTYPHFNTAGHFPQISFSLTELYYFDGKLRSKASECPNTDLDGH